MKTDYAGIDYGLGRTNMNQKTGIRYGVIHANEVGQFWYEDSEPYYVEDMCECFNNGFETFCECEPVSHIVWNEELKAEQAQDDHDIFVIKSKFYTWAQFCSPCAPGTGYLLNFTDPEVGVKTYCFGHDWFESGKAPYPVYEVETNKQV